MSRAFWALAALILGGALAAPAAARAADLGGVGVFMDLTQKDCAPGPTGAAPIAPNDKVRDKLFASAKLILSTQTVADFQAGALGTKARLAVADCTPQAPCKGEKQQLADLYAAARPLTFADATPPPGFSLEIAGPAPALADRAEAFLNGQWDWLTIRCPIKTPVPDGDGKPGQGEGEDGKTETGHGGSTADAPTWIIAKSEDDAGKEKEKRGFATFGYSTDRLTGKSTYDIDIYTALSKGAYQGFVSVQRHTSKGVDDLAFGAARTWFVVDDMLRVKAAWETDHRFDSSVWRIDGAWLPAALYIPCRAITDDDYFDCTTTVVADYVNIGDPGAKKALLKLSSFGRVGGDIAFEYGHRVSLLDGGYFVASAQYSTRYDWSGRDGDADLFTASVGFTPSEKSSYKVTLDYTRGRDLTDLTKEEKVAVTFGFRH